MNTPVNFEIAKLLKEKKFRIENNTYHIGDTYYDERGQLIKSYKRSGTLSTFDENYSAPTIAEVIMWLYEKYGIWIVVFPELFNGEIVKFYPSIFEQGVGEDIEQYYNSPTEAYEAAIEYTLKNLI